MADKRYGIVKPQESLPSKELIKAPHNRKTLVVGLFGPNTYTNNLNEMKKNFSCLPKYPNFSFRHATSSESISVASYGFGENKEFDAKRDIFDPKWLQMRIVRTSDGIFTNTNEINESKLKQFVDESEEVNGIYLHKKGIAFAPYDTFKQEIQDAKEFARSDLARVLEHSTGKVAQKLGKIASHKDYRNGVYVFAFDPTSEPVQRVAGLGSGLGDDRLYVDGGWDGDDVGCAFGVLDESQRDAFEK